MIVKSYIVAFCSLILFVSVGFSQSPAEKDLLEKLAEGPDKGKALDTVLKAPDQYSALILYLGALEAPFDPTEGGSSARHARHAHPQGPGA
ncbi:MAG TPA: hypothetical protein VE715_15640 [Blastocatellia bacterium]|nr:hypothetical protein [Blastocatellia bacterium]